MFYARSELQKKAKIEVNVDSLKSHCAVCNLYKDCRSPKMEVTGEGKKEIMIIGELPSDQDDFMGIQYSDDSGDYLRDILKKNGLSLNRDCWKVNAVRCYTDKEDKEKLKKEAKACKGYIQNLLYTLKPKNVLILGLLGIHSTFEDIKNKSLDLFRGLDIHDQTYGTRFFITFSPRQVHEDKFNYNIKTVFERDIKTFSNTLSVAFKKRSDDENKVESITDFKRVQQVLESVLRNKDSIYFDYEGTGLKPYKPGHKIVSIAFSINSNKAFAFPYEFNSFWTNKELSIIKHLWIQILADPEIKTMAHNYKFEDMWSAIVFGTRPTKFMWDTMIAAHIVDNRSSFTGLKFQTFANFGVRPYDTHMEKYIDSDGEEFNNILKAPLKDLLLYNGLDCLYGFELYEIQSRYLGTRKGLLAANAFFHKGIAVLSSMQLNGIKMDEKYYKEQRQKLTWRIKKLKRKLMKGREARKFKEHFGREMSLTSNPDIGKLVYEVLGRPAIKTAKGGYKTDKDTLISLNLPFIETLLDMKRLEKARGTYLAQFHREVYDGEMHPFFGLNIPKTYRSSSQAPNFQNQPKRDAEIKKIIRSGIIPSLRRVIMEADFSGAEVITSVCVTGDTRIETIEGSKSIEQIIKRIKTHDVFVYGYCLDEKRIKISQVTDGGITGKKKEVWKVTLDNGKTIKATPNHKFMIRYGSKAEGGYVELQNLKPGMSLMPFYKKEKNGYYYVNLNNRRSIAEHTLIGIDVLNEDVGGSCCSNLMYHKDGNGFNNSLDNLEFMDRSEHTSLHHKGKVTGPHSEEYNEEYNHKIVSVEFYGYEDVFNINVEGIHNYALSSGCIVKNCYHKDPTFFDYLMDKSTDMHRDQALDLWMLDRIQLEDPEFTRDQAGKAKKIRFFAKNDWTFAQFYGDWFDSCARNLWEDCIEKDKLVLPSGQLLKDHINDCGIYEIEQFIEHCKGVEDRLWNERFPQYTRWKKDIVKFYQKNGFIETFFGFRFTGYMDRKQCTNYPIQGTSFHLLVHTLMEVNKFIKKNKLKTRIIGQIHDSVISDVVMEELEFYTKGLHDIISNLHNRFSWLIVPMEMEAEITLPQQFGGNFNTLYEIKPDVIENFDLRNVYKDALSPDQYMKLAV